MSAAFWPASRQPVLDLNGNPIPGARLQLFLSGTTTPLTAFSDPALSTPAPKTGSGNQAAYLADSYGRWPRLYLPYVDYRERVTTAGGVLLWDDDGLANPAPASSGGGSTVPDSQLLKTGSHKWLPTRETEPGWIRGNGRTIGSVGSNATERANADTADLFAWFWNRIGDDLCPVSGGRGANAAADFAANKTLQVPDMRGVSPFGLDDMGNSAASRFTGVTFGDGDATTPGSFGGGNATTLIQANLPAVAPTGSVSVAINNITAINAIGSTSVAPGSSSAANGPVIASIPVSVASASFTGNLLGSGTAASTIPRFMLGTHYFKL